MRLAVRPPLFPIEVETFPARFDGVPVSFPAKSVHWAVLPFDKESEMALTVRDCRDAEASSAHAERMIPLISDSALDLVSDQAMVRLGAPVNTELTLPLSVREDCSPADVAAVQYPEQAGRNLFRESTAGAKLTGSTLTKRPLGMGGCETERALRVHQAMSDLAVSLKSANLLKIPDVAAARDISEFKTPPPLSTEFSPVAKGSPAPSAPPRATAISEAASNSFDPLADDFGPDDSPPQPEANEKVWTKSASQFRSRNNKGFWRCLRELHEYEKRRLAKGGTPLIPPEFWADTSTSGEFKSSIYECLEAGTFGIDIAVPCPKIPVTPQWAREAFWDRISLSRLRFKGDKRTYVRVRHKHQPTDSHASTERQLLTLHVPPRGVPYNDMHAALQASYRDDGAHFTGASGHGGLRVNCARLLELGAPPEEVARIQRGYKVALHTEPPRFHGRNYGGALDFPEKIAEETERMVAQGFVEGPLLYTPHIVQPLGGVWKEEKQKWRTIVNGTGSGVNPCSLNLGCTYDMLSDVLAPLVPGARMSCFDLTDAFLNWPYTEDHAELWGFQDPGSGDYYRYRFMAFGGRQSPSVQQRWARILQGIVNRHGLRYCPAGSRAASYDGFRCTGAYVDDFFMQHNPDLTQEEADLQYESVLKLLEYLQFQYKPSKNVRPTTSAEYLGFAIDTVRQTVGISATRASALTRDVSDFLTQAESAPGGHIPRLALAAIIGKLQWVAQIVPHGQKFLSQSYRARDAFTCSETRHRPVREQWSPHVLVCPAHEALKELRDWTPRLAELALSPLFLSNLTMPSGFWRGHLSESDEAIDAAHGKSVEQVEVLTGDACGDACGGWYKHHRFVSFFPPAECSPHFSSNYRELKTVLLMLRQWGESLRDCRVLVRSDNTTTVSSVNRGFSPYPDLGPVADEIHALAHSLGIRLAARHIPGLKNGLADRLSRDLKVYRNRDDGDWRLRQDEFKHIEALSGRAFDLDGASDPMGRNSHCARYCSVVDSLTTTDVRGMHLWCNPDWHMALDSLRHFRSALADRPEDSSAVFILPAWPTAVWWRQLRDSRLLAYYPPGTELFTAPDHRISCPDPLDRPRACFGGTKWGVVAVALGRSYASVGSSHATPGRSRGHRGLSARDRRGTEHTLDMRITRLSGDAVADADLLRRVRPRTVPGLRRADT